MTAHKNLIHSLDSRIEYINDAYQNVLRTADKDSKGKANINFRTEIAFFIHFIKNNYLTQTLFEELLKYNDTIDLSEKYVNSIIKTIEHLRQISRLLKEHQDFKKFKVECNGGWKNPFNDHRPIEVSLLLDKIEKIPEFISSKKIEFINKNYSILVSIYERWEDHIKTSDLTEIVTELNNCRKELFVLEHLTGFQKEYIGANSAIRLNHLYNAIFPMHLPQSASEGIFENLIVSGTDFENDEQYLSDCKKLQNYIIQKLDEGFSIDITIKNFIAFMENYRNASDYHEGERQLQKEFEMYLFNKGYFPLSEVQLKNARIDTLATNDTNAFLIEYKQILRVKSQIALQSALKEKIKSAFTQCDIYSKRLNANPMLQKIVYVMIFTSKYFIFKNGNTIINYNGLTFSFHSVYLGDENPSKIKKPLIYDIETILNEI
ncbi:hypothetical protein SAMN05444280_13336 [Tangfeifania diversioriginum]|uniref:PD-(D/E)XK nuclease superfamily protein n=1 Tax=Tangfeifania diversioriginum TaxID=1168035 RepID=A0A1M6MJK9_9BACT|nr:hypothetical protein [Tangfeifania diversioriginum]SHJ83574.1 hypothetical protein SAMN05444280_13336 [Tangfeifania diversioriginum]